MNETKAFDETKKSSLMEANLGGCTSPMTAYELQQHEQKLAEVCRMSLYLYLCTPTAENFQQFTRDATAYQTAWMIGRKRVLSD